MHPVTRAIRIQSPKTLNNEHATPIYLTSSFTFEDAETMRSAFAEEIDVDIYSRYSNPTTREFIDKICALEDAEDGFATASGMSAVFGTFMAFLKQGDHLLCCNAIFGSTHGLVNRILPNYGITATLVDAGSQDEWEAAITPQTKMLFIETPTNPGLDIIDLEKAGKLAKKHNLLLVVDNCFATPLLQQPVKYGADLIIHSATKWIDGQGRVLGGVVVGNEELIHALYMFCRNTGPAMSPFNAWVLSKSLETLDVRMERHCANALYIAGKLEGHQKLTRVRYPFLPSHPQYEVAIKQMTAGGGIVCFEIASGIEGGKTFLNSLQMLSMTANLGDTRSIASHPASTTHAKMQEADRLAVGITPGLIRISVGLEHKGDILSDILQALDAIK